MVITCYVIHEIFVVQNFLREFQSVPIYNIANIILLRHTLKVDKNNIIMITQKYLVQKFVNEIMVCMHDSKLDHYYTKSLFKLAK